MVRSWNLLGCVIKTPAIILIKTKVPLIGSVVKIDLSKVDRIVARYPYNIQ